MNYVEYLRKEIYPDVEDRVQRAVFGDSVDAVPLGFPNSSDAEAVTRIWNDQDFNSLIKKICTDIENGKIMDVASGSLAEQLWGRIHEISCENPIFDEIHERNEKAARELMWEVVALDKKASDLCRDIVTAVQRDLEYLIIRELEQYR